MPDGIHEFSAGGRQNKDSEELIYSWVAKGRHNIPQDMILRSFLKTSAVFQTVRMEPKMTCYSVYESLAESSADELDYSFIRELFMSDDEESD